MIPVALLGSAVYMVRELYPLCDCFSEPDQSLTFTIWDLLGSTAAADSSVT